MNLLLKECKNKWIVKKEKTIAYYIRHHHVPFTIFCHYKTNLMFQNLIKMWFVTSFLMIAQLLKVKSAIEQTIINLEWTAFVKTLCNIHQHKSFTKVKYVWTNLRMSFRIIVSTYAHCQTNSKCCFFASFAFIFTSINLFIFMGSLMF